MAADTQRHGWRTGTARMASGWARGAAAGSAVASVIVLVLVAASRACGSGLPAVDREGADLTGLDAPLLHDLVVGAVVLELLQRGLDGLVEAGVRARLGEGDAVGGLAVGLG